MVMTLPNPPAPRLPYDRDGTYVFAAHSSGPDRTPYALNQGAKEGLNADIAGGIVFDRDFWSMTTRPDYYYAPNYIALLFPHPTDLYGWFISSHGHWAAGTTSLGWPISGSNPTLKVEAQISYDTTNGLDGTWTEIDEKTEDDWHLPWSMTTRYPLSFPKVSYDDPNLNPVHGGTGIQGDGAPYSDSNIFAGYAWGVQAGLDIMYKNEGPEGPGWQAFSSPAMGVKGFRLWFPRIPLDMNDWYANSSYLYGSVTNLHLYGRRQQITANRLAFVGVSGSGDPDLEFGDIDVEETAVRTFKVKNLSSSLDADRVAIYTEESAIEYLPSIVPWLELSLDGVTWNSTVEVPAILAGAVSPLIYVRFIPGSTAIGRKFARVGARAREWS